MPIPQKLLVGADWIFKRYNTLVDTLPVPTTAEDGPFYHVATAISRTAIKNYALLREGLDTDDQEHLAWACRNLLELDVFMKCVLISKEKLEEFAGYRFIDGIQIAERLLSMERKYEREQHIAPNPNSQLAARVAELQRQMNAEGATRKSHLITREWAKTAGMIEEYDIINKVCSKLVHPTNGLVDSYRRHRLRTFPGCL
jgi:hypothetical protein